MLRHLMRSFGAVRGHLIFRLKCHVVAAVVIAVCYLALSTDIIPERVFGLIGFLDDILVVIFLSVLIARTYTSLDSSVTFDDIQAALEWLRKYTHTISTRARWSKNVARSPTNNEYCDRMICWRRLHFYSLSLIFIMLLNLYFSYIDFLVSL